MHRIDGEGATVDNRFTQGNPSTGAIATTVTADFLNAIQEELVAVILAAGIPLNKANNSQLLAAITSLIAGGGVAVSADGVSIADAGEFFAGGEVESALQQLAAKIYSGTFTASQIRRTVVALNGAAFSSSAAHAENYVEISNAAAITYTLVPDGTWNAPVGTAIHVVQSGAGQITFTPGAGVTLLWPSAFNAKSIGQQGTTVLVKRSANTWRLGGMLEAA